MLDYFALGLLFFVAITLFYGIIAIHDIPYEIAKHRDHPHQDAIHVAGWVSLFTLYREDRGWGFGGEGRPSPAALEQRLQDLSDRLERLEGHGGSD